MPTVINTNTTISQINISMQKAAVEAEYKALVTGIDSELTGVDSFLINQKTFTKADLVAKFQSRIDAAEKTKVARTALHACVAAERALQAEVAPLRMGFKFFLQSRYGKNSAELQKFGFTQTKATQRSAVAKSTAVSKGRATRQARGTKGKKQKALIKGSPPAGAPATPTSAAAGGPAPSQQGSGAAAPTAAAQPKPSAQTTA